MYLILNDCAWLHIARRQSCPGVKKTGTRAGMGKGRGGAVVASAAVLVVCAGFAAYAWQTERGPQGARYALSARFVSANGLSAGADVDMAGVTVGRVASIALDPQTQMALVKFDIDRDIALPKDSILTVGSPSMTGSNALMIEPGHDPARVDVGGVMTNTRAPSSLEQQVSDYIFGGGGLNNE